MVSKQRLREIFNLNKKWTPKAISDVGVWGCDMPAWMSYFKLKKHPMLHHVLDKQQTYINKCSSKILAPVHLKQLEVTMNDTWYLYPYPSNHLELGNFPAMCRNHVNNEPDVWLNTRIYSRRVIIIDIFETFDECVEYCRQKNQEAIYYDQPVLKVFIERLNNFHTDYQNIMNILRKMV